MDKFNRCAANRSASLNLCMIIFVTPFRVALLISIHRAKSPHLCIEILRTTCIIAFFFRQSNKSEPFHQNFWDTVFICNFHPQHYLTELKLRCKHVNHYHTSVVAMPVFSRILQKVSRWELPLPQHSRRELSSPPLSEHLFSGEHSFASEQMLASQSLPGEAAFRDQSESNDSLEVLSGNASCTLAASHVDSSHGSGNDRSASRSTAQSRNSPASCTLAASHVDLSHGSGNDRSASRLTAQSGSSSPASCTLAASHVDMSHGSGNDRSASRSVMAPDVLDEPSVQTGGSVDNPVSTLGKHLSAGLKDDLGEVIDQALSAYSYNWPMCPQSLYTPCACVEACPNAWFNPRLAEKLVRLPTCFSTSAMRAMLCGKRLTVSVALQIFDIPGGNFGMFAEIRNSLLHLSDYFQFTLVCERSGKILNIPLLTGGGKRVLLGRKRKRGRHVANPVDPEGPDNIARGVVGDEILLERAEPDVDSGDKIVNEFSGNCNVGPVDQIDVDKSLLEESEATVIENSDPSKSDSNEQKRSKARSRQSKYSGSPRAKSTRKIYGSSQGGRAARKRANTTYFNKEIGKSAFKRARGKYSKKDSGKEAQKRANSTYSQKDIGKEAQKRANSTYSLKDIGKDAHNRAYSTYSQKEHGIFARKAACKAYDLSEKRRLARKRRDHIKRKYMKRYMARYQECDKIHIDFSSDDMPGNTNVLREYVVRATFTENFQAHKAEILKSRGKVRVPDQYTASNAHGTMSAAAHYKLTLGKKLSSVMNNLDRDSWLTIPGVSEKVLKRMHFNPKNKASVLLAELTWLKRQQCATALKLSQQRLSSFADAIICKMAAQEKEFDQKIALLGLQCHQKMSKPYHPKVSFVDGVQYDYDSEVKKFEEIKKSGKNIPSHLVFKCNDGCIIPDKREDLVRLRSLFDECAKLGEKSSDEFRRFLQKFQWCTKWHELTGHEKNDLNPQRMYLFPVKHRNHPEICYIPPHGVSSLPHTRCKSHEVTMREFMVHYSNPRKFYNLISRAIIAHKLMSDIDAATIMCDVEYLSKLVKINLRYDVDARVGFDLESEARELTQESIEEKLAEVAIQGKTPRSTYSHKDVFDRNRGELPSVRCHCCDRLVTPSNSSTINLRTAKKLEYNPDKGIAPHEVFQNLQAFLVAKGEIGASPSGDADSSDDDAFADHPLRLLHGLTVCKSCRSALNKGQVPANSLMNNMYTGETPDVLKVLNPIELMFVSRTKCFQTIVKPGPISSKLPLSERLNAIKGNLIHLPLSTSSTAKRLYESADKSATERLFDVEDLVQLYGQPSKDKKIWNHVVDRKKVHAALTWLNANNPNYKDIIVPAVAEDILPNVFGYVCDLCQHEFDSESELSEHKIGCPSDGGRSSNENLEMAPDEAPVVEQVDNGSESLVQPASVSRSDAIDDDGATSVLSEADKFSDSGACESDAVNDGSAASGLSEADKCSDSGTCKTGKPWIEQVPKGSLQNAFQQFSVVGNESNPERDTFKMLRIGSDPVPYYEPNLDCMAFPDRYPYGLGGLSAQREKDLTDAIFEQTRLMTWNNHQRRNLPYLFHLLAQKEKRLIKGAIFSVLNKNFKSLSKKDIENGAIEKNPELLKRINSVLVKLPTQREFWNDVRTKVGAMVSEFGPPTFWATFSPGEYDDEDMLEYLRTRNSDLPGVENMTVSQLVCKDPVLACTYLQTKFDALSKFILSKANPIGKIKHHFVRTEYQTRLMPHFHCIFWLDDAPVIGQDSDEDVLEFIGRYISCKMPSPNEDPKMHGLVKKFQVHKCNSYCLRRPKKCRGKARCKFGFPRSACIKPVLHGVASSIASHKTGSYKKRLYELQRNHNEKFVNDYNPILLYLWQGNVDIQFIGEKSESLVDYISKYATKAPRSEITDFDLNAMKNENKSTWAQLFQVASRLMKEREVGAMEARNFLLSENPIKTDAKFLFINTVYASKRKSVLKSKKDLNALPDDSTDIYYGDLIGTWYPKRPPYDGPVDLKNMSLYEFAMTYERISNSAAEKYKDKSLLLRLEGNAGYMKKRSGDPSTSLVIYGPSYLDPFKDSEAYFFSFLLLHKPFWHESLLMGSSDSYQKEFERLQKDLPVMAAHEEKVRKKKNFRESMEKSAEAAANEMLAEEVTEPQDFESGSDFFEAVRKQSTIETEEQLSEAVAGLSPDQLAVYNKFVDNVNHYYQHKSKSCSCNDFKPTRLFVSGFGGSGKSHLIRTLMAYQYIRSEVNKDPCHFLLGAPTGIASHNIGGMTLHSMWNLPVDHSNGRKNCAKPYQKLNSGQVNVMRANYAHACGMIVDEVSMISNQMLMAINMRMNEVVGPRDPTPFGGMPIVVFGDLFQLEPVSGSQPFVPLTENTAKKMFGGFPCAPNLWEGFEFRQLNTNHRQKGDENLKWRQTLDHIRFGTLSSCDVDYLNERMIDTSGCKQKTDYLDRYVEKFLECENAGLGPVCLLPENKMVHEFNAAVMKKKGEVPVRINAIDRLQCPKENEALVSKLVSGLESNETAGLDGFINLAVNTRVMLRVNDKRTPGLVNGARGTVREIVMDNSGKEAAKIMVQFDGIDEIQAIVRTERKFQVQPKCYVHRKMFPLINSYAMTIHKSQSLSLSCVFADLGDKIFADGMSYVAVSRCMSHKGLHLMNFNPAKVVASGKACREYSRLLGKGRIHHNQGCKSGKLERCWYTTSLMRKATKATAEKIRQTAAANQQPCGATSKAKKRNQSSDKKSTAPRKRKSNVAKDASVSKPKFRKSDVVDGLCPGDAQVTSKKPTSSAVNQSQDHIMVTSEHFQTINYVPVCETWQRSICNAFGWKFTAPSRGEDLDDLYRIHCKIPPKTPTKIGPDGNCWYRSIALIATGDQENYMDVKNSVIQFMWANIDALQQTYEDLLYYRDSYYKYRFNSQYARKIILYHSEPGVWVRNVVMEMTAVMLNTKFYRFTGTSWESIESGSYPIWHRRDQFTTYPTNVNRACIPHLSEQSMYVNHLNGSHFETCHADGLDLEHRT